MAHKQATQTDVHIVEKARGFWEDYSKPITYIGSAIILVIAGWLIYKYMFLEPKIKQANEVIYVTQNYFSRFAATPPTDSNRAMLATKVINGDGAHPGALRIISRYSGTPAANLSQYYAGAAYLSLGQFDKAIQHLKEFDANGATQIKSRALGMLGDASAELKKTADALKYYKKAANVNTEDKFTSSEFLFRAANYAQVTGKKEEAIALFKKLKDKYPLTEKGSMADKYLARLGVFAK